MSDIIVTGFGPFRHHKVNASWEAVKMLPDEINGLRIIKKEVPVVYTHVENDVPNLWKSFNPILVLHVGVSAYTDKLTIEKCAYRKGYHDYDHAGVKHPTAEACCYGDDCIQSGIDVEEMVKTLDCGPIKFCTSTNAGRYLCEFIYYTSLNIDKNRSLFVHVPPLNAPYTVEQLAEALLEIILCALDQIRSFNDDRTMQLKQS